MPKTQRLTKPTKTDYLAVFVNLLIFLGCLLLLTHCASAPPKRVPVYRGVAQELPTPGTTMLVYIHKDKFFPPPSETVLTEQEAIMWLQMKGYTVIERGRIDVAMAEQQFSMQAGNDEAVLRAGKLLGARQIVFVASTTGNVTFRAIDTETGRILWSGMGGTESDLIVLSSTPYLNTYASPQALVRGTLDAVWASVRK